MLGVFFYAFNRVKTDTKTASADTITTTPYCKTIGTTTVDGSSSTGSPDCFAVYMHGLNNSGSQTVQRGYISNWSSYIFMVDAIDIKEHLTLALYKGNVLYKSVSVSGNENLSVNFGALASGYYTLKYECRYKKNLLSSNVYYTYEYFFEVDITNPSYSISEGTGTGNYTNRTIYYYADDLNFSHIRYRAPWDSAYSSYYGKSYTVEATQGNSGQWDFYAIDTVGNRSPIVTRWIDVKSPSGTVTSQSGTTISNGGATKEPFKYTASDNMSISRMEYKKAGSSTWETYTANKMISGTDGWYTFRAIDEAGNVSDEYRVVF